MNALKYMRTKMDNVQKIGIMMECCQKRSNSKEIDMHMVRHVVGLAKQLSEWEQSQLFAWCCGQLTDYRQRLQRPIRIKVLKETCHCDEEREAILNYITNKNKEIKDKNSDV